MMEANFSAIRAIFSSSDRLEGSIGEGKRVSAGSINSEKGLLAILSSPLAKDFGGGCGKRIGHIERVFATS